MKLVYALPILAFQLLNAQKNTTYLDIESLVNETQAIISIEKGQQIDTAYYRTIFLPSATFTVVGQENGNYAHETMQLDDFLTLLTDDYYSNGYFERGTGLKIEEYNGIAHVMQGFEGEDSEGEIGKGVNSYHLIYSDGRWYISSIIWAMSRNDGNDIPNAYRKQN